VIDSELFLFVSKLATWALYPLGLAFILVIVAGVLAAVKRQLPARVNLAAAFLVIWFSSTPVAARWLCSTLENQFPPQTVEATPRADVAIVLGGALGLPIPPRVEVELSSASGRLLHAARLYRGGKVQRILVAAGNLPWHQRGRSEAEFIKELLIEWGVPDDAIEIDASSRTTRENALEVKALYERQPFDRGLLVTSALHMPRAMKVFKRAGLPVSASTANVIVTDDTPNLILSLLPNQYALDATTAAVHEWLGLGVYWLRGYL
jgi:uncharacterized SAM-binding protein YcdF (DUF218 family)